MSETSRILEDLINALAKLPGIGRKSSRRMAYYLISRSGTSADELAEALITARKKLGLCKKCFNLSENELCGICSDEKRNASSVCVVETFSDLYVFEKAGLHSGTYHVLGGLISPLDGIGPSDLHLEKFFERLKQDGVGEVIIGLSRSVEGDTTALYISEKIKNMAITVTRLASGIPSGGEIEYIDELTLKQAFRDRINV